MKKRILIISNFYPPNVIGGYEIACHDTVKVLQDSYDVSVLTSNFKLKTGSYSENVIPELKCFRSFGYFSEKFTSDEVEKDNPGIVRKMIQSIKPDLVYVWNFNGLGFDFLKIPADMNVPIIYHFMDESISTYAITFKRFVKKLFGRYPEPLRNINLKGDYGIFISSFLKEKLKFSTNEILKNKVIYPYVNLEDIPAKNHYAINDSINAVFIGQIEKHKGIDQLCEAIHSFNSKSDLKLKLTVFGKSGSGLDKELLAKYNDFLKIQSGQSRDYILKTIHKFDLGFFPSIWDEPFGIAQIELMAAGLPVFSTKKGGSSEAVTSESSIDLDFDKLAVSLDRFITQQKNRELIGKSAREKVKNEFNPQVYSKYINDVVREVLNRKGGIE